MATDLTRLALVALLLACAVTAQAADSKIALVIGNSEYASGSLPNPANDAKMIGDTLAALGFKVIARRNADQTTMKRAIQEFGASLEQGGPGAVGLFYYAGHGVQLNGRNYLIPTGARIEREGDVEIEAVSADWVLEQMRYARNRLNMVILDACRNNPFPRSMRSVDRGLASMDAPAGILVAYSTAPGEVAADGSGRDSPYTEALARAMREDHEPIEQVFKHVRVSVMNATAGRQIPWESSSLTGDFYFVAPATLGAPAPAPAPAQALSPPAAVKTPPETASPMAGPTIAGARALQLLKSLGIQSKDIDSGGAYPLSTLRQLVESAPRRVTLGSNPDQIRAAYSMCQQFSSDCQLSWYADEGLRYSNLTPYVLDSLPVSARDFRQFADGTHYKTGPETTGLAYAVVGGSLQPVSGGTWRNALKQRTLIDDSAVVAVTFQDAAAYCQWRGARLPSEDEWEYAARGPERRIFPWGEDVGPAMTAHDQPPPVNDGPGEGTGGHLRGMSGNVWQWVDTTVSGRKVLKGGSWLEPNPANKRAATRRYELSHRADEDSGFRCARAATTWPDAELWMSRLK